MDVTYISFKSCVAPSRYHIFNRSNILFFSISSISFPTNKFQCVKFSDYDISNLQSLLINLSIKFLRNVKCISPLIL